MRRTQLMNGARILVAFGLCLLASTAHATRFTYNTPLIFPHPDIGQGAVIRTTDLIGVITRLRVTLHDVNIPEPAELEVYFHPLEHPGTQIHLFTRFHGNLVTADHATITFDDFTARRMDIFNGRVPSGTFQRVIAPNAFSHSFTDYIGSNPNLHWELFVYIRGQGSIGSWSVDIENAEPAGPPQTFTSASGLSTNDSEFSPATPYPATLEVSGLDGMVVIGAGITLTDFSSPRPEDHDMLVESPDTRGAVFFSDLGANCIVAQTPEEKLSGGFHHECAEPLPVEHLTMSFAHLIDAFPPAYPFGPLQSATYPARDIDLRIPGAVDEDEFRVPIARFNNAHDLRALNGAPANGQWSLFVRDDNARHSESSTIGSWSVTIWPGTPEPLVMAPVADIVTDAPVGQCSVPVTFDSPFVRGSPTPTLTVTPASGTVFPVGITPVHLTAFNYVATADAMFTVTVRDLERPVLATPFPMVFSNEPNPLGTQVYFSLSVSDNCPGVTVTTNPPSGDYFPLGTTHVTAYATDASGNQSDPVTFTVTIDDTTAPVITYQTSSPISPNWVNHDVTLIANATDVGGTGVVQLFCQGTRPSALGIDSISAILSGDFEYRVTCFATDAANNQSQLELPVIRIDKTPPQIVVTTSPPPNAHGWNNTDVAVHFDVSDATSGILDADDHIDLLFTNEGTRNLTFFARDNAGNCAVIGNISMVCPVLSAPVVKIDKTAPQLTVIRTPANANGWNNTDVEFHASATDAVSGIDGVATVDRFYNHEGRGSWFGPTETFTFTDFAGNSVSASPGEVNIDKTPPQITFIEHQPPPNEAGWNRTPPVIRASVFEPISGSSVTSFQQVVTAEGEFDIPFTVTDNAGNSATHVFAVKTDFTAPTATASRRGPPNANGWDQVVFIDFISLDAGSGVPNPTSFVTFSTEGHNLTATGPTPIDRAGNVGVAATLTGLNVDHTPPTLVTKSHVPLANANGWNNTDVTVTFTATDALSGMDGSGNVITQVFTTETTHQAAHTFTDLAGNNLQVFEPVRIDKTPPSISSFVFPPANAAGWNNTPVTLRLSAGDNHAAGVNSGVDGPLSIELAFSEEGVNLGGSRTFTDFAGNTATASRFGINIDRTPPTVAIVKTPLANAFDWNTTDVTVHFAATDAWSGTAGDTTADVLVTGEVKNHQVMRSFFDVAGNRRDAVASVSIDRTAPNLFCAVEPPFITPGSGLVPVALNVFFDDGDEFTSQSRGPAFLRLQSIVSSAPQEGDIVDWTAGSDDRHGLLLAPSTSTPIVYTLTYEGSDLAGHVASCTMQVSVANPKTEVASVSPSSAVAGAATDVSLVIAGAGFIDGARVLWNGTALPSTFVSENEMHATVPAALLVSSGGVAVAVENPAPYAGMPGTGLFLVTDAPVTVTSIFTGQSTPENPFVSLSAGATPEGAPETVFVAASGVGTLGLATYTANPGATFAGGSHFFDVFVAPGSTFDDVGIFMCALNGATDMFWFNGELWQPASHQTFFPGDEFNPPCIQVTVSVEGTSPTIADLTGTYFAPGADISAPTLALPASVSAQAADANGAIVTFAATATDDTDAAPVVSCTPASGSLFPLGSTEVTCTGTDATGNVSSGSFSVNVTQMLASGRMSGGGFVEQGDGKHHVEFNVSRIGESQTGRVGYWVTGPARGRRSPPPRFESAAITSVAFATGEKSVIVKGDGTWNGDPGYSFELRATDASRDSMSIVVKDAQGVVVGGISGSLNGGNIQSKSAGQ